MAFCIRPELAVKLKDAAKAGEITIEKLYTMSSEERNNLFGKYVDKETATGVNAGFEKAMASEQQQAIAKWVKSTFSSGEKKKAQYQDIITKVNDLNKQGVLTPDSEKEFLRDLVTEKLGGTVTADEAKTIAQHAARMDAEAGKVSEFGTPTLEYFKARKQMDDYIDSLVPSSQLKVFTSTIGRGAMLMTVKSPLLNIVSNSVMGFLSTAERRITMRKFNGFNSGFSMNFMRYSIKVFKETGYDLSRFQAFEGGRKSLGEEYLHSQGKGLVRAVGRFYEDVAFQKMQGLPDASFSAFHFADSANLSSSLIALQEGLKGSEAKARALAILKDAFNTSPVTKEGIQVRTQAEADALYATYTNKSIASKTALALRGVANTATGDFRLGDITDPFVKTPANVLQAGLDYSGASFTAKMATGIIKSLNDVAHLRSFDSTNFANVNRYMVRAGMGLTFAYVISSMIKPEDFIGQYPTTEKERQLLSNRNAATNAIRVGDKWVSLDYLGPLGAALLGFLYAKKYGNGSILDGAYRYGEGVKATLQNFPGIATIANAYQYIKTLPDEKNNIAKTATNTGKAALGALTSRIVPGIVSDLAKMTDTYQRSTDKTSFLDQIKSQIPVVREGLPIKRDLFGDPQKTESWVSTLLFGGRVKTNNDSQLINNLVELDKQHALPAITDVSRSSSRAKELRNQIGEQKFNDAMYYFGQHLKQNFLDTMNSGDYQSSTPQEKQQMLNKVKEETFNDTLDQYGYVKPVKK